MGVTKADLIRSGVWLEKTDEEWTEELRTVKEVLGNYARNDSWAVKIKKNIGILLTGSTSGSPFLKGSVESHRALGYWTVLSFDNFINPETSDIDYNALMPPKDIMEKVDSFIITHPYQTWGGVSYPFIFQLRIASGIFHSFDYVFVNNSDCIIEKPEGIPQLIELLGDGDILSSGPALEREIGTAGILMRSSAFIKIAKHMNDHMVPHEEYNNSTQEFGNTEGRLAVACRQLGLKVVSTVCGSCPTHVNCCEQMHESGHGTWYDLIGFRHIHGELNYAYRYKGIPPSHKYLDVRYANPWDYAMCKAYDETKDIAVLKDWWEAGSK